jgi:hypothetical protein
MTATRRHWALAILGAWIAGSICMSVVATENFYTIDRLLGSRANAAFGAAVDRLGAVEARDLLRYLSSELNRLYFQLWNGAQIVLGVLALWLLSGSTAQPLGRDKKAKWGIAAMLAIVVLMLAYLTPAIVTLGRSLDFVPRDPAPPGMSRFWILHAAYTSLEMLKLVIALLVAISLAKQRGERLPSTSTAAA